MVTKVENILAGMTSFAQKALNNREKYLVGAQSFTRQRMLDFNKLCFF
jgi:hypothetical protein